MADTPQLLDHDLFFQAQLQRIFGMLPAAAATADGVVRAGRLHAARRGAFELFQLATREVAPCVAQSDQPRFARQRPRHEHHAAIRQMPDGFAAKGRVRQLNGDWLELDSRRSRAPRRLFTPC